MKLKVSDPYMFMKIAIEIWDGYRSILRLVMLW